MRSVSAKDIVDVTGRPVHEEVPLVVKEPESPTANEVEREGEELDNHESDDRSTAYEARG